MAARYRLLVVASTVMFCLVFAIRGHGDDSATAATASRTVEVFVLAFRTDSEGKGHGSVHPTQITVGGQASLKPRLAFVESEVSGTGNQWRSAGWAAAVTAAQLTDFNPQATQVTIAFEGRLDGPSAGGLMTVGILSAVRGDTPRADAAMTGTINPDGTIGPVGGIVHKISGAAAAGKKLVLIPLDSRFQQDKGSGKQVDLVEHGRKLGVEVRQVGDIYTAYRLLTGKELPRPAEPDELRVPDEINEMVKIKFRFWTDHYKTALQKISDLDEEESANEDGPPLLAEGAKQATRAQKLLNEGEFSAAYNDAVFAAAKAYIAMEYARCAQTYSTGGMRATTDRVRNNAWLVNELDLVAALLRARTPRSFDQLSEYIAAVQIFIEAVAYHQMAEDLLKNIPEEADEKSYPQVAEAAQDQIIAWLDLLVVRDSLDFLSLKQGAPIQASLPVGPIADFYRRAAEANHAVFESLVIEPTANSVGATTNSVRAMLHSKDYTFAVSQALFQVRERLNGYFDAEPTRSYAQLAMALAMHLQESSLVAKYYSLSAELDEYMQITSVKSEGALNNWLQFSEDQTRRNLGELARRGIDPTTCLQLYEMAHMMRMRDLDEKLDAIGYFWQANLNAAVIRHLARSQTEATK